VRSPAHNQTSVLILAGQRQGVIDPLCAHAGVERKAVIPICGIPMIDYVLLALSQSRLKKPFHISGFDAGYDERLEQSPKAPGPAGSALAALEAGITLPVLITTCDHPLLTSKMIEEFIAGARKTDADFCVGLAEKTIIQPAYPNVKRTYLKFSDTSVSGCNLFYIKNEKGLEAIRFWKRAQHYRKQPLKLAASVGWSVLFRYIFGRLSVSGAFKYASNRLGITAEHIFLSDPEAAIDVDKPSDKDLVETILKART